MEKELRVKVSDRIRLTWDELRASDLAGRAKVFQSMVGAGMEVAQAASLSGLMEDD